MIVIARVSGSVWLFLACGDQREACSLNKQTHAGLEAWRARTLMKVRAAERFPGSTPPTRGRLPVISGQVEFMGVFVCTNHASIRSLGPYPSKGDVIPRVMHVSRHKHKCLCRMDFTQSGQMASASAPNVAISLSYQQEVNKLWRLCAHTPTHTIMPHNQTNGADTIHLNILQVLLAQSILPKHSHTQLCQRG